MIASKDQIQSLEWTLKIMKDFTSWGMIISYLSQVCDEGTMWGDIAKYKSYPTSFILPDIDSNMILKEFGEYFFESCKRSDSDHILMTLAGNFYNFMKNLSALHSYLSLLYQPRNDII